MAAYYEAEDLINVGAYHAGSNPKIDDAIARHGAIEEFLIQSVEERCTLEETLTWMLEVSGLDISQEEMLGMVSGGSHEASVPRRREKPAQVEAETNTRALNSVAALFSTMESA
jgi:hypothetical protein